MDNATMGVLALFGVIFSPLWVFGLYWLIKHWALVSTEQRIASKWIADSLTLEPNRWRGGATEVQMQGLHVRLFGGDGYPIVNGEDWHGFPAWRVKRAMQKRAVIIALQALQKSLV